MRRAGSPITFTGESGARRPRFMAKEYEKLREATGVGRKGPTHIASEAGVGFAAWGRGILGAAVGGVERTPEIPGCDTAPGAPAVGVGEEVGWFYGFAGVEVIVESEADGEIAGGHDVGAAEAKNEQHGHGPRSNTAHAGESFDERIVGQAPSLGEIGHDSSYGFGREIANSGEFGSRKSGGAEGVVVDGIDGGGSGRATDEGEHMGVNLGGGLAVQLLVNDGADERGIDIAGAMNLEVERTERLDALREFGVVGAKFTDRAIGVVARLHSPKS